MKTAKEKNVYCQSEKEMMMIIITIKTERVSLNIWWECFKASVEQCVRLNFVSHFMYFQFKFLYIRYGHTVSKLAERENFMLPL